MKEKEIETGIKEYLLLIGAIVEGMQGGKILIKKGKYQHMMTLQKEGCPDIMCFYKGKFLGIEVKKNKEEVDHWLKLEHRFLSGEKLPKSYEREENQIKYKQRILKNLGDFIITYNIQDIINWIEKQNLQKV